MLVKRWGFGISWVERWILVSSAICHDEGTVSWAFCLVGKETCTEQGRARWPFGTSLAEAGKFG